jgi:hypothetical protein
VAQGVGLEVEEAAVVSGVGLVEELEETLVGVLTVYEALKPAVVLYPPVLTYPQEDYPVDGVLDGEVELMDGEARVSYGEVPGEGVTPRLYLFEKFFVYLPRSPLPL